MLWCSSSVFFLFALILSVIYLPMLYQNYRDRRGASVHSGGKGEPAQEEGKKETNAELESTAVEVLVPSGFDSPAQAPAEFNGLEKEGDKSSSELGQESVELGSLHAVPVQPKVAPQEI